MLQVIPTITEQFVSGSSIQIKTSYFKDELPNTIQASIKDVVGMEGGVSYVEGELLMKLKNSPEAINYQIDEEGNLILLNTTGDNANYSINTNGELIYIKTT